jgi:hypothetical protein
MNKCRCSEKTETENNLINHKSSKNDDLIQGVAPLIKLHSDIDMISLINFQSFISHGLNDILTQNSWINNEY